MQRLAWKLPQRLHQRRVRRWRYAKASAVERIAHQRVAKMTHVHADLVGPPGFQLDPHVGMRTEAFQHPIVADGRLATVHNGHALALLAMTADRRVDGAAGDDHADDDGFIDAADTARLQLLDQTRL